MPTLAEVYRNYSAPAGWGDKGTAHDYLPVYEREMTRRTGVTLCEIGVYAGHSVAMWADWLTDSTVIGLDIDLTHLEMAHDLVHLCDATDPDDVDRVLPGLTFDYVIDDGSHTLADQLLSLSAFLPRMNPGARYFIEDIAGDAALGAIVANLEALGCDYDVYDGRSPHRQPDEILVTIRIPDSPA